MPKFDPKDDSVLTKIQWLIFNAQFQRVSDFKVDLNQLFTLFCLGANRIVKRGYKLPVPKCCDENIDSAVEESKDSLVQFVEHFEGEKEDFSSTSDLYNAYRRMYRKNISINTFSKRLVRMGYEKGKDRDKQCRGFKGLKYVFPETDEDDENNETHNNDKKLLTGKGVKNKP